MSELGVTDAVGKYLQTYKINRILLGIIITVFLADMLEFYDFGLLSVVIPIWINVWKITGFDVGLLVSLVGVGGVIGAFGFPVLADRIGRRPIFVITVLLVGISTALISAVPEYGIAYVFILRFLQGVGIGATYSIDYTIIQEFAPERHRGFISGLTALLLPLGISISSLSGYLVIPVFGWRGLFVLGVIPAILSLMGRLLMPESPRWLYSKGKIKESARALAWLLRIRDSTEVNKIEEDLTTEYKRNPPKYLSLREQLSFLVANKRSFTFIVLGGFIIGFGYYFFVPYIPTFLVYNYKISAVAAAGLYALISLTTIIGRFVFSALVDIIGRKMTIGIVSLIPFIFLILTSGYFYTSYFLPFILPALFVAGAQFSATFVYANDLYPTRSRASASGMTYTSARIGSIISPTILGLLIGSPPNLYNLVPLFIAGVNSVFSIFYNGISAFYA
jgi:Arabinose efflux permease